MTPNYPRSIREISPWATEHGATIEEARHRYAQFAALCGIASVPALQQRLVLKGGNAIDFVWFANRSTRDLDFSLDDAGSALDLVEVTLRQPTEHALRIATARFGIAFAINSFRQHPPGTGKTFVTFEARVGYGLPDEPQLLVRMRNGQSSPHLLPIEISINEPICESIDVSMDEGFPTLRVSTMEEIVSEKLRALLQQSVRNRHRRQDVLDIAVLVHANPNLDRERVGEFLQTKAAARGITATKAAFRDPELASRARLDYDQLSDSTRTRFIPFDDALAIVLALVDDLDISG